MSCVWDITNKCNKEFDYTQTNSFSDELTTVQALNFIDMCANIGVLLINFFCIEASLRKDLYVLISHCRDKNILPNLIVGDVDITEDIAKKLKIAGICEIVVDINEFKLESAKENLKNLKDQEIYVSAITTVTKRNINILEKMKKILVSLGINFWQLRLNKIFLEDFEFYNSLVLEPENINDIMNFCYESAKEKKIKILPVGCTDRYVNREAEIKKQTSEKENFELDSCSAGIESFGILSNGDIVRCIFTKDKELVKGNIKEKSLEEVWNLLNTFCFEEDLLRKNIQKKYEACERCIKNCDSANVNAEETIYLPNMCCSYCLKPKNNLS
jgi:radical SAM protein with 4Fe4S-binding SPASM domain